MNGKLVILAGGIGSRMRKPEQGESRQVDSRLLSEADSKPKAMIGVGEGYRPFLDYLLYNAREAGYRDVVIVINERDDSIRSYYGRLDRDNEYNGLIISYAIQQIPPDREKPLGTADALLQALLQRSDWEGLKFTVCNSDNLYSTKALKILLETSHTHAMIDYDRSALRFKEDRIEKFAVTLKNEEGCLIDILEKPSRDEIAYAMDSNDRIGVSMNIFSFSYSEILPILKLVPLHPVRKEKELPQAVKMLIQKQAGCMMLYPLAEHVPDLTSKQDIASVIEQVDRIFHSIDF